MVFDIYTLVEVVWLIIPAFAANGLAPLVKFIKKKHRIDAGRKLVTQPVFGNGKTWEGLLFGAFIGLIIGTIQMFAYPFLPWEISAIPLTIVQMSPLLGLLLGLGAMLGDLGGSFLKRRFKMKRGEPAPLLDQEDFLLGALFFAAFLISIKIDWLILLVVITPIIHWVTNVVAFVIKLKREPH